MSTPTLTHDLPALVPDDELLERCRLRAGALDRDNGFFHDDLAELTEAGYLRLALPAAFGGAGASLSEVVRAQRRLAAAAPATALALSMHLYLTGAAAELAARGDRSVVWMLEEAAAGELFAAGHAEAGNDLPVLLSTSRAERIPDGYRITGRKRFGSLGPVWTRLAVHALDAADPTGPKVVHAVVAREAPGVRVHDQWDVAGMRATQSYDTDLDGVVVRDDRVVRVLPAGDPGDPWFQAMGAWAFLQFAAVYTGIAERALVLAVGAARSRTSIAIDRGALAYNPSIQQAVAEMYVDIRAGGALVDATAAEWSGDIRPPDMAARILATKYHAVAHARRVVDRAAEVAGAASVVRGDELERLVRDVRCGSYNGMNAFLALELVGKGVLGVEPVPRW